jgi:TolB protein
MRWLIGTLLVAAMLAFGLGAYHAVGYFKGSHHAVRKPTETSGPTVPGTIYLVQSGAIYRFQRGAFRQITSEEGWMQPAPAPQGQLVAVRRQPNYSDLYILTSSGRQTAQMTHDAAPGPSVENNHWAFYPRYSPDGQSLFYSFDPKDSFNSYRVDFAIFASSNGREVPWTNPNWFTGGDVAPLPLKDGALIYTKYSIDDSSQVHSQIWIQRRPGSAGQALTSPDLDCGQPALSTDEKLIAMVCTSGSNLSATLMVAPFDAAGPTLGAPATLVTNQLVSSPAFSPDGKTIAFLAPSSPGGAFQLWTVGSSGSAAAREITTDLGLDSRSAPVWLAG